MALRTDGEAARKLTFGHPSRRAALEAIGAGPTAGLPTAGWQADLIRRLRAFSEGQAVDFRDVPVDLDAMTPLRKKILGRCRQIPYGATATYGQLAARAGVPRAARAVGNCMAANPLPLVIPCHRVVPASGPPGAYSAPGGAATKTRLLAMESKRGPANRVV